MHFSSMAQREVKQSWVDALAADFDLDQLGYPFVNRRSDNSLYVVDGQHRVAALRQLNLGDQSIQCFTWYGLSEEEEAKRFLKLNNRLIVGAFPKFMIGVTAGEDEPVQIKYIVERVGLKISLDRQPGSIHAVSALRRAYRFSPEVLYRTLQLTKIAYGDSGHGAPVINGFALLIDRFADMLDDEAVAERLGSARGSVGGLLGRANALRLTTGAPLSSCVAAAAQELWNSRPKSFGGRNLPNWWKAIAE